MMPEKAQWDRGGNRIEGEVVYDFRSLRLQRMGLSAPSTPVIE